MKSTVNKFLAVLDVKVSWNQVFHLYTLEVVDRCVVLILNSYFVYAGASSYYFKITSAADDANLIIAYHSPLRNYKYIAIFKVEMYSSEVCYKKPAVYICANPGSYLLYERFAFRALP